MKNKVRNQLNFFFFEFTLIFGRLIEEEPKESKSKKRSWSDGGSTETGSIDANKKRKMNNDDDDIELILEANDNNTNNADDDEFISIIE